jgi:hypothetical protein
MGHLCEDLRKCVDKTECQPRLSGFRYHGSFGEKHLLEGLFEHGFKVGQSRMRYVENDDKKGKTNES